MASKARAAFDKNAQDVQRLMALHEEKGGKAKGRRFGLEVLNKSAIVLLTSFWEAYCEDIAAEALEHIVAYASSADKLPVELRKVVAKELKADLHDLAIWQICGDGWRAVLKTRLASLQAERNRRLNTAKVSANRFAVSQCSRNSSSFCRLALGKENDFESSQNETR